MQGLPYDIIHMIVSELKRLVQEDRRKSRTWPKRKLSPYAAVCRSWNSAIERETFKALHLRPDNLDHAEQVLSNDPTRRSAVRFISFTTFHSCSGSKRRDLTREQLSDRDQAFSRNMSSFFRFLAAAGRECPHAEKFNNMALSMEIQRIQCDAKEENDEHGRLEYIPACLRYVGASLPTILYVKHFVLSGDLEIWPTSLAIFLSAMDGLEGCNLSPSSSPCVEHRKVLGENICQMIPMTCESVCCQLDPAVENFKPQLGFPAAESAGINGLCTRLRDLSTRLVSLHLYGVAISPSLFWPDDRFLLSGTPHWPKLEYLCVHFSAFSPPAVEDFSVDQLWDPVHKDMLFTAMGKAAPHMPSLKYMVLEINDVYSPWLRLTYKHDKQRQVFFAEWTGPEKYLRLSSEVLQVFGISEGQLVRSPPKTKRDFCSASVQKFVVRR